MSDDVSMSRRAGAGITLIEVLISIAIIGVLIGILAPALFRVKASAGEVKSLANLRGIGLSYQQYAHAHQGTWPFPPERAAKGNGHGPFLMDPRGVLHDDSPLVAVIEPIWHHMRFLWPALLHDVAPWPEHYETWLSPGKAAQAGATESVYSLNVSYHYSNSFLGAPQIWTTADATEDDIRAIHVADVSYPSNKVIMFDEDRSYLREAPKQSDRRPLLFADGSASARLDSDAMSPVQNQLSAAPPNPYHDTPGGVDGRDF